MQPPRMRAALAFLAVVSVDVVVVRSALAAPLPRLVVQRDAEAADCPDARALAAAVERQMQRPALDPAGEDPSAFLYEVHVRRTEKGYTATLHAGDLERDLDDPGATCEGLADALALTLAILLDSDTGPAPAQPQPPPQPPPLPQPQPRPLPQPQPRPLPQPQPPRRWSITASLGGIAAIGMLAPSAAGVSGDASFRFGAFSFGVGALGLPPVTVAAPARALSLGLAAGTLRACYAVPDPQDRPFLSLCAQTLVGAAHAAWSGIDTGSPGAFPWLAVGALAIVQRPIAGPVGWSVRAGAVVPLYYPTYDIDERFGSTVVTTTLFSPSPVGGQLGLDLWVKIR